MSIAKYLHYDPSDIGIYMPNEIFDDFRQCDLFKTWKHKAYAYTFYYLHLYIYRNTKYGNMGDISHLSLENLRLHVMKYASKNINYVTKTGGVLDQLRYTYTTTNYPIKVKMDEDNFLLGLQSVQELKKELEENLALPSDFPMKPNFQSKAPLKAFKRHIAPQTTKKQIEQHILHRFYDDSLFVDSSNTHFIPFKVFAAIMDNIKLSYVGFYIYGYLKYKCDKFKKGYSILQQTLADQLQMSKRSVSRYLLELEKAGLIYIERKSNNAVDKEASVYHIVNM